MRSRAIHSRSCPKRCRPLAAGGHTGRPHEDLRGRAAALCFVLLEALASQSAAEDCNGNGRPDSDDVAPTHIAFGAPREFQAALEDGGARGPAFADFDQDGNLDVLLMDNQNVYLLRNVGGGTFEQPVTLWYGIAPSGVVAPDLDQDGSPDVASWEGGEASLIVLRNRGDGTFADAEKQPLGVQVDFLSAANLDQNRAPDLVLAGGILSGSLVILRNDGRAGFTVEKHPMPGEPSALLVADFDGDRSSDILIPAVEDDLRHPPRVVHDFLYRNNGDGTFALAKDLGLVGGAFAADFDGDGDVDLADYGYHLFRNRGDASFSERETIDLPIRFSTALVGDVDGDARPDFYGAIYTYARDKRRRLDLGVALNSGNGTFHPALTFRKDERFFPASLADLNGDGSVDFFCLDFSSNRGLVLFRLPGLFPQSQDVDSDGVPDECQPDCNGNDVPDSLEVARGQLADCNHNLVPDECEVRGSFRFTQSWSSPDPPWFDQGLFGDLNGDAVPDIAGLASESIDPIILNDPNGQTVVNSKETIVLLFGDGRGGFGGSAGVEGTEHAIGLAAGDFDHDGDLDLATCDIVSERLMVFVNSGDGSFEVGAISPLGRRPFWFASADLDADGNLDVLVDEMGGPLMMVALAGAGDGTFDGERPLFPALEGILIDVNADGRPDFVDNDQGRSIGIRLNQGGFTFAERVGVSPGLVLATGDFDGDGSRDIIAAAPNSLRHFGLYDDGKGNFNEVDVFKEPGSWGYATAGDVDGDGDEDLAAIDQGGLTLLANDGKGVFAAPSVFIRAPFRLRPPLLVDMNGDGAVDLVIPPAAVLLNDSVPSRRIDFDANGVPDECEGLGHQVVGDANQDGLLNLSDAVWLLRALFAGAGTPLPCSGVAAAEPSSADLEVIDANDDGRLDIADAVSILRFLFLGDAPSPRLGNGCEAVKGCPAVCFTR